MKFNRVLMGSAVIAAAFSSHGAFAAGTTLGETLKNSGIAANGWISGSYVYGFNDADGLVGRQFDGDTDSFLLNQAAINISMLPTEGFGGLVTLLAGEDAASINSAYGDNDDNFTVNQAYFQYASGPLTIIGGRYNTLAGMEVIADPLNANLSRSLLFFNAEPFVHTGVRASFKVNDMITLYGGVNNTATIISAADDTNQQKTIELGIFAAPTSAVGLGLYDYIGTEADGVRVNFTDFVGTFTASDALSFGVNGDYVDISVDGGNDSTIAGGALYASFKINDLFKISGRGELVQFNTENDGVKADNVKEVTLTLTYSPASNFDVLFEGRVDKSKHDVFVDGTKDGGEGGPVDDLTDTQPDVAIKGIFKFGV